MSDEPQAIFFDLDGTILDWQSGMERTWLAACEEHCEGSYAPAELHEAIRARRTWFWDDPERARTGRMNLDEVSREIVRRAFADSGLQNRDLAHRIANDYRRQRIEAIAPYAGAVEALAAIRARGTPMALLTNGEAATQRRSVDRYDLAQYFDCILIEGEFGVGKPDERVFRHALAAVSGRPETTWMIGDNLAVDIAPAVGMGMHGVWVDAAGDGLPEDTPVRPDRIVRAISELV
ncbi:MAG: HAD family hydrolase [Chloroflexi bacterium]|nr:HAD family hydrolase [Chloroflexota bacterium]